MSALASAKGRLPAGAASSKTTMEAGQKIGGSFNWFLLEGLRWA